MKRWIHAATDIGYDIQPGDTVTVYESKVGYSNYDATLEEYFTSSRGVKMAKLRRSSGRTEDVPASIIIPSEKEWFYSISLSDVLTKEFVSKLTHKDDSMWCSKIPHKRVDLDRGMENVTGVEADIMNTKQGQPEFRVMIVTYTSKHYEETRDIEDEWDLTVNDPMIEDALAILKTAPEVVVNFAGYQRTFKR